jgi:hypothetical protein
MCMNNPFQTLEERLSRIENLLLDIINKPKDAEIKRYSVKSLALSIEVSELSIRNWIKAGKIQATRIGGRIFIDEAQFVKGLVEVKSLKYKR